MGISDYRNRKSKNIPNLLLCSTNRVSVRKWVWPGFFDPDSRHQRLEKFGYPLLKLAKSVDWEGFHPLSDRNMQIKERGSGTGRKQASRRCADVQYSFFAVFLRFW